MISLKNIKEPILTDYILWKFATDSLLHNADREYILARESYFNNFDIQFLWLAHQAIEKYLKSILLYNRSSAKEINHDLNKAIKKIILINEIKFVITDEEKEYIINLNINGQNRYFDKKLLLDASYLNMLDKTVWSIRRYCDNYWYKDHNFNEKCNRKDFNEKIDFLTSNLNLSNPVNFRLNHGFIEKIFEKKSSTAYKMLVYKNFYYGSRRKNKIKNTEYHISRGSPVNINIEEGFEILNKYVKISKDITNMFQKTLK